MSIQLQFQRAMKIRHVGTLDILGMSEKYGKDGDSTIVTFMLNFTDAEALSCYFAYEGFRPDSLLWQIFVGDGQHVINSMVCSEEHFLVFTREVAGNLRNPRKFLHATAQKLLHELQEIEENDLLLQELAAEVEWGEYAMVYPGRRGPMPSFRRPRHT